MYYKILVTIKDVCEPYYINTILVEYETIVAADRAYEILRSASSVRLTYSCVKLYG